MKRIIPVPAFFPVSGLFRTIASVFLAGLFLVSGASGAERYAIDPIHSNIGFAVRHLVINKVKGEFPEFSGTILYDEEDVTKSSVEVTIQTKSIDTGNADRDRHLRSAEFFDVETHPELTFRSREVRREGDRLVAVGTLTIHGVSREIELPFTILGKVKDPWGKTRIGVEATLKLNRQDFGVSWSKKMDSGGWVVGNEVMIELNVEAIQEESPPTRKEAS